MGLRGKNVRLKQQVVDDLRAIDVCVNCGAQPVEYHHIVPRVPGDGRYMLPHMIEHKEFELWEVIRELEVYCEPLCKSCHSKRHETLEPGRMQNLNVRANIMRWHHIARESEPTKNQRYPSPEQEALEQAAAAQKPA